MVAWGVLVLGTFPPLVAVSLWVDFGDEVGSHMPWPNGSGHNPVRNMHWVDLVASAST